ncbi:Hypothetical_protein [Hexamita inflata]|uniref:Hypothetical_protein n=1 Tax=Hexamita inflata TaxID=28002 RepID=A0AA86NF34_9EUKA|nr:Hypothetical protein HINF_LOCUS5629 [Hexamita inflata]
MQNVQILSNINSGRLNKDDNQIINRYDKTKQYSSAFSMNQKFTMKPIKILGHAINYKPKDINIYIEQIEYYHRYCQKLSRDSRFMHACPLKQQIQKMMVEKKDEIVKKCQKESEQMMSEFYQQIKNSDVQDHIVDQTYLSIQQVRLQFMRYLNQFLNYPQQSVEYELLQLTNLIQVQPPENIHEIQTSQVQSYLQQFHEISQNCINQLNDLKQQQAVMSIDSSFDEVIMLQSKIIKTIESCSEPIALQILLNFCWELQKRVFVRKTNPDLLKNSLIRNRNAFGKLIDSDKKIVQQNEALKIQYSELIGNYFKQIYQCRQNQQLDEILNEYLLNVVLKGNEQCEYIDEADPIDQIEEFTINYDDSQPETSDILITLNEEIPNTPPVVKIQFDIKQAQNQIQQHKQMADKQKILGKSPLQNLKPLREPQLIEK